MEGPFGDKYPLACPPTFQQILCKRLWARTQGHCYTLWWRNPTDQLHCRSYVSNELRNERLLVSNLEWQQTDSIADSDSWHIHLSPTQDGNAPTRLLFFSKRGSWKSLLPLLSCLGEKHILWLTPYIPWMPIVPSSLFSKKCQHSSALKKALNVDHSPRSNLWP